MKELASDEKSVNVMIYTNNMLARGELIAKENSRVSILLRTQGVPNYFHLFQPQVISFAGGAPKTYSLSELFIPATQLTAFHISPPAHDPLDYDANEANRRMQPLDVMTGSFSIKGNMRISSLTDISTGLDVMRASWVSIYDADISNPFLPQFTAHVPMLLVNSIYVNFGIT